MKPKNSKDLYTNEEIIRDAGISRSTQVRVIGNDGSQLGLMSLSAALDIAYDEGLDLALMSAQGDNPVCKVLDYGKFCFKREKMEKEAKKKQVKVKIKEIQLSVLIDVGDINTKAKQANKFLQEGNKVKVVVKFVRRQITHPEIGEEVLAKFTALCEENGVVDKKPVLEGKNLTMFLAPKPTK